MHVLPQKVRHSKPFGTEKVADIPGLVLCSDVASHSALFEIAVRKLHFNGLVLIDNLCTHEFLLSFYNVFYFRL